MTNVTIKEFAEQLKKRAPNTTPESLMQQFKEAGVKVSSVEQEITAEEKRQLLQYLQKSHGSADKPAARSKMTLKVRKKRVGVVKQGKKSVNVEFRGTRTYKKPEID